MTTKDIKIINTILQNEYNTNNILCKELAANNSDEEYFARSKRHELSKVCNKFANLDFGKNNMCVNEIIFIEHILSSTLEKLVEQKHNVKDEEKIKLFSEIHEVSSAYDAFCDFDWNNHERKQLKKI